MVQHISNKLLHSLKKWLPAIFAATLLHMIIIFVFLNTKDNQLIDSSTKISKDPGNEHSSIMPSQIMPSQNIGKNTEAVEPETLVTLTDDINKNADEPAIDSELSQSSKGVSTLVNSNQKVAANTGQTKPTNSHNKNDKLKNSASKRTESPSESIQQTNSVLNTDNKNSNGQRRTKEIPISDDNVATDDDPIVVAKATNLPRDKRLLPSDMPASNLSETDDVKYDTVAQEVEDINAKLSATINSVKEKNMREIEALRAKDKAAYLSDQQNKVNKQIAVVGEQLGVNELADSEFSEIVTE